jgi:hypothetical protein
MLRVLQRMRGATMRQHYGQTKAARQAEWCAQFNDIVVARVPALSGRIDWPTALHYYHTGHTPQAAADSYCIARNIEWGADGHA